MHVRAIQSNCLEFFEKVEEFRIEVWDRTKGSSVPLFCRYTAHSRKIRIPSPTTAFCLRESLLGLTTILVPVFLDFLSAIVRQVWQRGVLLVLVFGYAVLSVNYAHFRTHQGLTSYRSGSVQWKFAEVLYVLWLRCVSAQVQRASGLWKTHAIKDQLPNQGP